ncbi:hypothetical protein FSP39_004288 [Pinctada imbricata]|uniref:Uncharacterized protein n=1 Tax=Pinctada imbricata TaxID=66713 RepID=A0AA89BU21_PINIB|nr:hypothetical protein FSP39_004288 [Pinctada imbricata]
MSAGFVVLWVVSYVIKDLGVEAACGKGYSFKCPKPIITTIEGTIGLIVGILGAGIIVIVIIIYCVCIGRRLPDCCKKHNDPLDQLPSYRYSNRDCKVVKYPPVKDNKLKGEEFSW